MSLADLAKRIFPRKTEDDLSQPPLGGPDETPYLAGVIDVGSNSVRLVIYECAGPIFTPVFNEKVMCGLGHAVEATRRLDGEGRAAALSALGRYRAVADVMGASDLMAVATAAVRAAEDRDDFLADAMELGVDVRVLTGEEEAQYAAYGVIAGRPDADGLVGDLGGGSLELLETRGGWRTVAAGRRTSERLGALALMSACANPDAARDHVRASLSRHDWIDLKAGRELHLVGGAWRNIARLEMDRRRHPIEILQSFEMSAREAKEVARFVTGLSPRSLERTEGVSKKRVDALPYAAAALEALVEVSNPARVVVSSFGLREGLLFERLSDAQRDRDPLLDGAAQIAARLSRDVGFGRDAARWIAPLVRAVDPAREGWLRLARAAALCADVAWRCPPAYRGRVAFDEVLFASLSGADHRARTLIALMLFHRYQGVGEEPPKLDVLRMCDEEDAARAAIIGLGLRLAATLTGRSGGVLPRMPIELSETCVSLTLPADLERLMGESAEKRLNQLAGLMGRNWAVNRI